MHLLARCATRLLLLALLTPFPASATMIRYQVTDLANEVAGDDLWSYTYDVSGFTFTANTGFTIYFDVEFFSDLEDPPPFVHDDWDVLALQPDAVLAAQGAYDALALVDGPSLAGPFTLRFVWLGGPGTAPDSQPFDVNEFDSAGNLLRTLESGTTVPEPSSAVLLVIGLCMLRRNPARPFGNES